MSLQHQLALVRVEALKLQSRRAARFGWLVLLLIGLAAPLMVIAGGTVSVNNAAPGAGLDQSAANGVRWALIARNFYVTQAFLLLLGATSLAGELQAHTLRETLARPVPRWAVLLAKWGALSIWSAVGLAAQWVAALGAGLLLLQTEGSTVWADVLSGYVASWVVDTGFAAVVLMVAVLARSVPGSIAGLFLFLVLERVATWGLWAADAVTGYSTGGADVPTWAAVLLELAPWLPSSAWGVWRDVVDGTAPLWQPWAALLLITMVAIGVAERALARIDVP